MAEEREGGREGRLSSARTISQVIAENSEVAIHLIDMRRRGAVCRRGCLERRKRPRGREGGREGWGSDDGASGGIDKGQSAADGGLGCNEGWNDCEIDPPCGAAVVAFNLGIRSRASTCVCVLACLHLLASVWFGLSALGA